ncbi:diguanylate cyclase [Paenibacillus thailandensis]|uniref:Diguanylate cyclase n=1 Tax=Paenibacillus thailandensis TaxID=393250 RepID=A0ABW5QTR1_9BACL
MKVIRRRGQGVKLSVTISTAVLLSVLLTLLINMALGYRAQQNSLYETTLESNAMNARVMSRTANSLLLSMANSIETMAEFITSNSFTEQSLQDYLDYSLNAGYFFNSLILVNSDGVVEATSPGSLHLSGRVLKQGAAKEALESRQPSISKPYTASTGRMIVFVSHPIFGASGQYKGMIAGTIYLQEDNLFNSILGQQLNNANGTYFYVVDSSGYLIYHPNKDRIGESVAGNSVVKKLLRGESGSEEVINTSGKRYLSGYASIPATGWGIVTQTPVAVISEAAGTLMKQMLLYSSPFILLLVLLTFFLFRKFTDPLRQLAHYAGSMTNSDQMAVMPPSIKKWNYEANELSKTITFAIEVLKERSDKLHYEAHTDALTGLMNRRTIDEMMGRWMRERRPFSLILIDMDRFKSVNDTYGHRMGDEVIKFLASVLVDMKGKDDLCCRYGGEEFVLLLPLADTRQAFAKAERIRMRMESENSPTGMPVTLSLGVSSYPCQASKAEELFHQADEALYQAKRHGRNRTVVYGEAAVDDSRYAIPN